MQTRIHTYLCPSDEDIRGQDLCQYFTGARPDGSSRALGKSNYVMNESVGNHSRPPYGPNPIAQIKDGTSNTMQVAEKDQGASALSGGTGLRVGATWTYMAESTASVGFRSMSPPNSLSPSDAWGDGEQPCARYRVGSMHPGGLNVLFCDGAVHFVSETIEAQQGRDCGDDWNLMLTDPTYVHKYFPGTLSNTLWQKLFNRKDNLPAEVP